MPESIKLTKIVTTLTTEARDFPYTLELFGTNNADDTPAYAIATNTGATVDPSEFVDETLTANAWVLSN